MAAALWRGLQAPNLAALLAFGGRRGPRQQRLPSGAAHSTQARGAHQQGRGAPSTLTKYGLGTCYAGRRGLSGVWHSEWVLVDERRVGGA